MPVQEKGDSPACSGPYNAGAQARIAGRPQTDNPHPRASSGRWWWSYGWQDTERLWGLDAKGPVPALPPAKRSRGGRIKGHD